MKRKITVTCSREGVRGMYALWLYQLVNSLVEKDEATKVRLKKGETKINPRNYQEVIALGVKYGEKIWVCADGPNAKKAIDAIALLLTEKKSS